MDKKRKQALLFIVLLLCLLVVQWFSQNTTPSQTKPAKAEKTSHVSSAPVSLPVPKAPAVVSPKQPEIDSVSMKSNALFIAGAYADELRYPSYSRPLSKYDLDRLEPNFFAEQKVPVNDEGAELTLSLEKYRFISPEPVNVKLSGGGIEHATVSLRAVGSNDVVEEAQFEFKGSAWLATLAGGKDYPMDAELVVNTRVMGKSIPMVAHLKYVEPTARIVEVKPPTANGSDMQFEVKLDVTKAGLYRVKANLLRADGSPIAHLVNKKKLSKGNQSLDLNAHVSVLEGQVTPFMVTTFTVELMSPKPGVAKRYGYSDVESLVVDDFSVDSLQQGKYQPNVQELQRLEFLKQMAGD